MNQIVTLLKMNFKLLLRNKGFLFFLLILPILSILLLNLREEDVKSDSKSAKQSIIELSSADISIVDNSDLSLYVIKVFDSSESKLTNYILEDLIDTGFLSVYRYHSEDMTREEIEQKAQDNANNDRIGTILYFSPEFEKDILNGQSINSLQIYRISQDERQDIVEEAIQRSLQTIVNLSQYQERSIENLLVALQLEDDKLPQIEVVEISNPKVESLDRAQRGYQKNIGYSFAILSLGLLFCGVFVANTVIEERENRVFTRITLTKANIKTYIISKLLISVLISGLQTVIIGVGIFFFTQQEFGISSFNYLLLTFLLGLIFNTLSLCVGTLLGNAMATNYAVFGLWSITCMISGLYFNINNSSEVMINCSNLAPQRWFMKATEMLMLGDTSAYGMILTVTIAFLTLILSIGVAGLKLKHEE